MAIPAPHQPGQNVRELTIDLHLRRARISSSMTSIPSFQARRHSPALSGSRPPRLR
jgi:hypothetical protein